jgi:predicted ArsR family transcriptional regulator
MCDTWGSISAMAHTTSVTVQPPDLSLPGHRKLIIFPVYTRVMEPGTTTKWEERRGQTVRGGLQVEARALGDPTRHRIFRHIAGSERPVGVAELTKLVGLKHNAVRQHLGVLKEAGLVLEQAEVRDRPGRPRLLYRLNPEVRGSWGTEGPYEVLATLLSESVRVHASPREVGRRAGKRRAQQMPKAGGTLELLEEDLVAGGFRPVYVPHARGCEFVLGRCPFVEVAAEDPETVCQLHLGLAEGIAAELHEGALAELVAADPRRAGCRLRVRVPEGLGQDSA